MELRHLKYFGAVADSGNFTKASQRLRVAQPALSRQVKDLEDELGVRLLERSPRGARLTPAGAAFVVEARAVLERAEEASKVARAFASGERGELQIGYAPSPTVELLPRTLHAFQSEAPGVRVRLNDLSSEEMLRGLRSGKLHVALMVRPSARYLRGFSFDELARYPVCVAVPPGHRLGRARRVRLEDVAREPLLVFSRVEYPEYHEWLEEVFRPTGLAPRIAEEHDGGSSLIAAAEAGRGVALVLSCFSCLAGPRLRLKDLQPAPKPFVVGVAYNALTLCPVAKRFIGLLKQFPKAG